MAQRGGDALFAASRCEPVGKMRVIIVDDLVDFFLWKT